MERVKKYIKDYKELMEEWNWEKNNELGYFPNEIMSGTHKKIFWKCNKCGYMWQAAPHDRTRKDGRATGCPECKRNKLSKDHLTPIAGVNDLETCYPEIAKEWNYDKNLKLLPSQVLKGSSRVVWWKCSLCGKEWKTAVHSRTGKNSKTGCPDCSAKRTGDINARPVKGENDLETVYPNILKEWDYEKNINLPSTYMAKSNKKVWWKCEYGHEWEASIASRVKGRNCPICQKEYKVSFPEKAIFYYIQKYYPNALENYSTKELKNKELDIYIPEIKTAIEYDGFLWHKNVEKDREKDNLCKKNNIVLIRVREEGLAKLNTSSIICDVNPNRNDHKYLEDSIKWVLNYLKCASNNVDIEKDNENILRLMQLSRKKNSILKSRPDVNLMWDNEKNGDLIPELFTKGSEKIVWAKCTKCGQSYQIKIKDLYKKKTTKCIDCANFRTVKGINDFKTKYPKLAKEWDSDKNHVLLEDLNLNQAHEKYYWKCSVCGFEWKASIYSRKNSTYCPRCASTVGVKTRSLNKIKKEGSLATNFPNIAKEWHPTKNGNLKPEEMTCGNKKVVWWKCCICGNEWQNSIALRTKGFGRCKKCNGKKELF